MTSKGDKRPRIVKYGENGHTYVFAQEEEVEMLHRFRPSKYAWQIIPSIIACLFCIPFGMMLGWPSPTYLLLLSDEAPIPLTIVQSPLLAGFLMFGNIIGSPFSNTRILAARHAMLIGLVIMTIGWSLMWQARDVYYFFGSRIVIGVGNGYGTGQAKRYIKETCDDVVSVVMLKAVTLFMITGVLLTYIIGPHVEFFTFSLIAVCITVAIFAMCLFLPATSIELVKDGNVKRARKAIQRSKPNLNVTNELERLQNLPPPDDLNLIGLFKQLSLYKKIGVLLVMAWVQQFCGAPATIVYCQFIFKHMNVPFPQYCALLYGIVYLVTATMNTYVVSKFNKKYTLLVSCSLTIVALVANILCLYFNLNETFFEYTTLITMLCYIFFHTLGLGMVPFTFAEYLFPKHARIAAFQLYFMAFSGFAVVITKLFQVFFSAFELYTIFILFASVGAFGILFITIFVPSKSPVADT